MGTSRTGRILDSTGRLPAPAILTVDDVARFGQGLRIYATGHAGMWVMTPDRLPT